MDRQAAIGRTAYLNDIHCRPKEIGKCKIIAVSSKGPDYVVVEWVKEHYYRDQGDVSAIPMAWLRFPDE